MKLIGVIAILAIIAVGCEKEDIRPNTVNPAANEKMATTGTNNDGDASGDDGQGTGTGIVDPNSDTDASAGRKKGK